MANLRSLTEEGGFLSAREPLPFVLLLTWKKLLGLNYAPAFLSLAGFFYSLFLHLFLLLLRRNLWGRNHYLALYLAAFLPFSYSFPTEYFPELVALDFILLVFLTFRLEKMGDLLVFPSFILFAFLSSLKMFLLAFTFFVLFSGIRGARKQAQKTSVFFKKRNVPFIFLLTYLFSLGITIFCFSYFDFFGKQSSRFLFQDWLSITKLVIAPMLLIGIAHILLKTEKELNTYTASVVAVFLVALSIFFIYRDLTRSAIEPWDAQTNAITKAFGQAAILKSDPIYLPKEFAYSLYFSTKTKTNYLQTRDENPKIFIYVKGIWTQDVALIQKTLFGKRNTRVSGLVPLGEDTALVQMTLSQRIKSISSLDFINKKISDAWESIPEGSSYGRYTKSLQAKFGYLSFF
ncbi:hypothetical protein [Leptospira ryugenii]|nr:hypothetical protein [Leptospira ryugenii]